MDEAFLPDEMIDELARQLPVPQPGPGVRNAIRRVVWSTIRRIFGREIQFRLICWRVGVKPHPKVKP